MPDPNLLPETEQVPPVANTPDETSQTPQTKPEETAEFWKTKFENSSREANILLEADKQRERAVQELTKQPTESELRAAFPSWDVFDEPQKELARRAFGAERTGANAVRIAQDLQNERAWNTSIELAISSDQALQGKEQAFKQFASKPQYKNVPMDVLIPAFLQKNGAPAPTTTPPPPPKQGLETGNGGPRTTDKPKKLSAEEIKTIRETDSRRYNELVKSGQIDLEV